MTRSTLVLLLLLAGCVEHRDPMTGPSSIKVEFVSVAGVSPPDLGSFATRRDDSARAVVVNLTILDAAGNVDTTFTNDLQAYVQFLGTLTPYLGGPPLATVHMDHGVAQNVAIMLPPVFGPTNLWFDDGQDADPTYVTGASLPIWFHDPYIRNVQTPSRETALDALSASPLQNKNIDVNESFYKDKGLLVVTSVFAQGYTIQDMNCPNGVVSTSCTTGPYDGLLVFTFSAPQYTSDENRIDILSEGQVMTRFNGGVEEFNGLTEIGFPQNFPAFDATGQPVINTALEPTPKKIEAGRAGETDNWFGPLSSPTGIINFERYEASPVELDNGVVCQLDSDYTTYKQWKIDPNGTPTAGGSSCMGNRNVINVITAGVAADLDPATLVGKTLPKVVGIVRPVSIGTFNVWIVYPRSAADLTLP